MLGSLVKLTKEELEKLTKEQLIDLFLSVYKTYKDLLDRLFECDYEKFLEEKIFYKLIKSFD